MQVTFVARRPGRNQHSIERVFETIQGELTRQGHSVRTWRCPFESRGLIRKIANSIWALLSARGDILHVTGDVHYITPFLRGRCVGLTIHDCILLHRTHGLKRFIARYFWFQAPVRRADYVTCISIKTQQEIIQLVGLAGKPIHVIPNPLDDRFEQADCRVDRYERTFLHVGSTPHKNLERAATAAAEVGVRLRVVGEFSPGEQSRIQSKCAEVEFLGIVDDQALLAEYQRATALVFASTYEGFGMPIIEAQACGTPVITSDLEPMRSVAGGAAILCNPFDSTSIGSAIAKVINRDTDTDYLVDMGRDNARRYSAQQLASAYLDAAAVSSPS